MELTHAAGELEAHPLRRFLSHLRIGSQPTEDRELVRQVEKAVRASVSDTGAQDTRLAFVRHYYGKRLANYRRAGRKWRATAFFSGLTVAFLGAASAVAGALGKGVSAGSGWSVAAIATGSAVGVITALTRVLQPEGNYGDFDHAWRALRTEGWDYVQAIGAYKSKGDPNAAYVLFAERVTQIVERRNAQVVRRTQAQT